MSRDRLFAEIYRLHCSGMGKKKIAKTLGVGKSTVQIALWFEGFRAAVDGTICSINACSAATISHLA